MKRGPSFYGQKVSCIRFKEKHERVQRHEDNFFKMTKYTNFDDIILLTFY